MSREIDEQVSSAVMGEHVVPFNGRNLRRVKGKTRGGMTTTTYTEIPAYSTDPAAAMRVVERMREKGYDYEIRSDGDRVVVTFYCPPDSGGMSCGVDVDGPAKELCATIARSALRAVGGEGGRKDG